MRARRVRTAWNWCWSSAAAHVGEASPGGLLDLTDWGEQWTPTKWRTQLVRRDDDQAVARLRLCTHRGRPLGSDSFVSKLERLVGWRLRALPIGRPRKQKETKGLRGRTKGRIK